MCKYIFNTSLIIMLIVSILYSLSSGTINISFSEIISILTHSDFMPAFGHSETGNTALNNMIVMDLRLPRILGAGIVGACLGASGAAMQAIFRNPLADPSIIGVGTGSALAIVIAIVWLPTAYISYYTMPIFAFIGALIVTAIIYRIGTVNGRSNTLFIILGGIAISIFAGTLIGLSSYLASDAQLHQLTVWGMGSLSGVNWSTLPIASIFTIGGIISLLSIAAPLDIFALGEYECKDLGLNSQYIKRIAIIAVALSVGASIAIAGPIGFIGLVVPHILRLSGSSKNTRIIPLSAIGGAVFLILCDTIARTIALPMDVPVGLVTGVPGGIIFITLLSIGARKSKQEML